MGSREAGPGEGEKHGRRTHTPAGRRPPGAALEALRPLSLRAPVGDRARGLLGRRRVLGLLPARPRAKPRLPLGRGRAPRLLRPPGPALLRPGALERAGSNPEGAPLRLYRARGKPRRGREGAPLLPRLDTDPRLREGALQVPAAGLPLRATRRGEPQARPRRARVRARGHGRLRRGPLLRRRRGVREGEPERSLDPHHRREPRRRGRAARGAPYALVPQHLELGPDRREPSVAAGAASGRSARDRRGARAARTLPAGGGSWPRRRGAGAPLHRERDESAAPLRRAEPDALRE